MTAGAPDGLLYQPEFITQDEEHTLAAHLRGLAFSAITMRGQVARRRSIHFGWVYGYESWRITPGPPIPEFLDSLRARAAALVGATPPALAEVLVTEYPAGAGIGWHRDAPQFGDVIGVSLLGECRMRFEHGRNRDRLTYAVSLAPRSAYALTGDVRWQWRHSIPPTRTLRYSITFRALRERRSA